MLFDLLVGPGSQHLKKIRARKFTNVCLWTSGNPQPSRGDKLGNI